jgi:hypothetical protein
MPTSSPAIIFTENNETLVAATMLVSLNENSPAITCKTMRLAVSENLHMVKADADKLCVSHLAALMLARAKVTAAVLKKQSYVRHHMLD